MDKHSFYLGLAIRILVGFLLVAFTVTIWQFQTQILSEEGSGWFIFTGLPLFVLFGLILSIGADIIWLVSFLVWIFKQKHKKNDIDNGEDHNTIYLP